MVETPIRARKQRLALFDLSPVEIARLHAPVGLDLGGKTPSEIAAFISAEIVAVKNGVPLLQKKKSSALPLTSALCIRAEAKVFPASIGPA